MLHVTCRAKPQQQKKNQQQTPPQALQLPKPLEKKSSLGVGGGGGGGGLRSPSISRPGGIGIDTVVPAKQPDLNARMQQPPDSNSNIPVPVGSNCCRRQRERQAGGTEPYPRRQGCVALALNGDVAELARLASQCLELLASQSVTAVNDILA